MHVLTIDADPAALAELTRTLAACGVQDVHGCDGAEQALAWLQAADVKPDLLISELGLPGMDAVALLRQLAQLGFQGRLLVLSSADERTRRAATALAGVHGLRVAGDLPKPTSPQVLRAVLDTVPRGEDPTPSAEDVRQALARDQLSEVYLPKIELKTGHVIGMESLIRWRHPTLGLVPPARFLPVARDAGLIPAIRRVTLMSALRELSRWQARGLRLELSVNVTMEDLVDEELPGWLAWAIESVGVGAQNVVVEVADRPDGRDWCRMLEALTRLRMRKVRLAVDDFASSSIAHLRDAPFDELKLDRTFIHGAHGNLARASMVEAAARLTHELGLRVVAEGVEDAEDWAFVQQLPIDLAQGWYISRELPGVDVVPWCATWARRWAAEAPTPPPPLGACAAAMDSLVGMVRSGALPVPLADPRLAELQRVLYDLDAPIDPVLGLLRADHALTAAVLGAANSGSLSAARPIVNLREACVRLGNRRVFAAALETLLISRLHRAPEPWNRLLREAWQNARATATLVRHFAREHHAPNEIELLALLHNVGVNVLLQIAAARGVECATDEEFAAVHRGVARHHEEVGHLACAAWGLPSEIGLLAGFHRHGAPEDPRVRGLVVGAVSLAIDCGFPLAGHDVEEGATALTEAIGLDFKQARQIALAVLYPPTKGT